MGPESLVRPDTFAQLKLCRAEYVGKVVAICGIRTHHPTAHFHRHLLALGGAAITVATRGGLPESMARG